MPLGTFTIKLTYLIEAETEDQLEAYAKSELSDINWALASLEYRAPDSASIEVFNLIEGYDGPIGT